LRSTEYSSYKLELKASEVEREFLSELQEYHTIYAPLFRRREQREESHKYLKGLLSDIDNKSVESMVLHFEGNNPNAIRSGQQFLGKGAWSDGTILERHRQEVAQDLGDKNGVFIIDGSDFPKQGEESVGVKRQYCGQLGKVANCQAGVFLGYASQKGYTLLDRRLYLPEKWVDDDDYAEKRAACGVPVDITFQTKPQLAEDMLLAVIEAGILPFSWLACDSAFGRDTHFLDTISEFVSYFAEVDVDTRVWLNRPVTAIPEWSGVGRRPTLHRLVEGEPDAVTVDEVAQSLPSDAWQQLKTKEGTKGPIVADFACLRVVAVRQALPGPDVWLIFRRNRSTGEIKFYLSNAPIETTIQTFAWISGMRWPIETCFEEGKQELGMGDYQVRSWTGWHHHMTLVILAHFFLVRVKLRLKQRAPALTLPQTILLLQSVLPKPELDAQLALDIVSYRQLRNHQAYLSHCKARMRKLNAPAEVSL